MSGYGEQAPGVGDGSVAPIAARLGWLRMPLGGPLGFINLWVFDDGDAWTIVDCGLGDAATHAAWRAALAGPLAAKPVGRILITHGHPDHFGAAGWLARETKAPLFMTPGEYEGALRAVAGDDPAAHAFYIAAGWDSETLERWLARIAGFRDYYLPLPGAFTPIRAGMSVRAGDADWRIVGCSGHSPEHAAFWSPEHGALIAGDQVLPRITASVAVWPSRLRHDPLAEWLDGLDRLQDEVPDDVLVLPSHGDPFRGLHARIEEMRAGHHAMIARVEATITKPRRIVDLLDIAFQKKIGPHRVGAATGEVAAVLHWLEAQGRAERVRDGQGVDYWSLSGR